MEKHKESPEVESEESLRVFAQVPRLIQLSVKLLAHCLVLSSGILIGGKSYMFRKGLIWLMAILVAIIVGQSLEKYIDNKEPQYIQSCEADGKLSFYICYEKWLTIHKQ